MGWKQDRVYVFIWAAQFLSNNPNRKFFFDKEDLIFFSLYLINGKYEIFERTPINLSKENEIILKGKIEKVNFNSAEIIEITKSEKKFDYVPGRSTKTKEEYQKKFEMEQEMINEGIDFLKKNNIEIEKTDVIEFQ